MVQVCTACFKSGHERIWISVSPSPCTNSESALNPSVYDNSEIFRYGAGLTEGRPWRQHRRFAQMVSPLVGRLAPLIGASSIAAAIALGLKLIFVVKAW